jgi:hypothetical protein
VDQIPTNSFFEVGINLTALGLGGECFPTFALETRSSESVTAQLKDFLLHQFQQCGFTCDKTVSPTELCTGTGPISYEYTVNNTGNVQIVATLLDDNGTTGDTSDDFYVSGLGPAVGGVFPQCTVTAASPPPGTIPTSNVTGTEGCKLPVPNPVTKTNHVLVSATTLGGIPLEDCPAEATVTVNPTPSVAINSVACNANAGTVDLTATASGGTPPYTISFGGTSCTGDQCGGVNHNELTITAGPGSYTATVTDSKGCVAPSAQRKVGVCTD